MDPRPRPNDAVPVEPTEVTSTPADTPSTRRAFFGQLFGLGIEQVEKAVHRTEQRIRRLAGETPGPVPDEQSKWPVKIFDPAYDDTAGGDGGAEGGD